MRHPGPRVPNRLRMAAVMLPRRTSAAASIALILIVSIAGALLSTRPPFPLAAAERLVEAVAFRFLGPLRPPRPDVVVVGITEDTLAAFPYRSPIDRAFLADVIDALARGGVAAIGLDVVLDRPTEPAKDAALRRALTRTDIPVVAISVAPDTAMPADQRRFLAAFLAGVRTGDANLARDRFDDRGARPCAVASGHRAAEFPGGHRRGVGCAGSGSAVSDRMAAVWTVGRTPDLTCQRIRRNPSGCCRRTG